MAVPTPGTIELIAFNVVAAVLCASLTFLTESGTPTLL